MKTTECILIPLLFLMLESCVSFMMLMIHELKRNLLHGKYSKTRSESCKLRVKYLCILGAVLPRVKYLRKPHDLVIPHVLSLAYVFLLRKNRSDKRWYNKFDNRRYVGSLFNMDIIEKWVCHAIKPLFYCIVKKSHSTINLTNDT